MPSFRACTAYFPASRHRSRWPVASKRPVPPRRSVATGPDAAAKTASALGRPVATMAASALPRITTISTSSSTIPPESTRPAVAGPEALATSAPNGTATLFAKGSVTQYERSSSNEVSSKQPRGRLLSAAVSRAAGGAGTPLDRGLVGVSHSKPGVLRGEGRGGKGIDHDHDRVGVL